MPVPAAAGDDALHSPRVSFGAAQAQPVRDKLDKVVREGLAVAKDDALIRVIITVSPNARQGVLAKLRAHGVEVSHDLTIIPAMAAHLPAGLIRSLEKDKDVVAISYDDDVAASGISSTVTGTAANSPYTLRATLGLDEAIVGGATGMTSGTKKTSLPWAHAVGSGSHRLLVVSTAHRDGTKSVTGVTYGGAALTQIAAQRGPSSNISATLWYLVNPQAGSASVVVTLSGSVEVTAGAIELATSINPTMPANSSWPVTGVPESTTIDGQTILWGDLSLSQAFSASLSVLTTTR